MRIQWGKRAEKQFLEAIEYNKKDSDQNAQRVGRTILAVINSISENPEKFGLEKYKQPNDGTYRYFNKYHYRISFRVQTTFIKIIRVRHQKRKPTFL